MSIEQPKIPDASQELKPVTSEKWSETLCFDFVPDPTAKFIPATQRLEEAIEILKGAFNSCSFPTDSEELINRLSTLKIKDQNELVSMIRMFHFERDQVLAAENRKKDKLDQFRSQAKAIARFAKNAENNKNK